MCLSLLSAPVKKKGATISVVDDDEPVRKALRRLVGAAGFEVQTFASGKQFLESLKLRRPDCAVVDLHLPMLTGLEVQEQLTREHAPFPVIMITGRDEPGLSERARAAGAAAFLCKPIDQAVLLETIVSVTHLALTPQPAATGSRSCGSEGPSDDPTLEGSYEI